MSQVSKDVTNQDMDQSRLDTVVILQQTEFSIQMDNTRHHSANIDEEEKVRKNRHRYSAQNYWDNRSDDVSSLLSSTETRNMSFDQGLSLMNKESKDSIKKSIDATPTNLDVLR